MALSCPFLWWGNIPGIYVPPPLICGWTFGGFSVLTIVDSAAVSPGIHVSFQIMVFYVYMPKSGNTVKLHGSRFLPKSLIVT